MNDIVIQFFNPIDYFDSKGIFHTNEGPNSSVGWESINCPWCGDIDQHLGINLENNALNCWRCGGKSIVKLVQLIEDCNWSGAVAVMEKFQSYNRPEKFPAPERIPAGEVKVPKEFKRVGEGKPFGHYHLNRFLTIRGFDSYQTPKEKEIYYSGFWGVEYKFRILFPVYIHHQLVTFMTRDVTGKASKPYIACDPKDEIIPIKHTLYGHDDVTPSSPVVLVEGPIDQWKLGRGSLATWGTGWTIEQVALLRSLNPKKVYTLFDSEEIAQESAKRLSKAIWFCDTENLYLDDRKDPGELTLEEGKELMKGLMV
jgi:hypothetical protein